MALRSRGANTVSFVDNNELGLRTIWVSAAQRFD
jgi:hypothetical protein